MTLKARTALIGFHHRDLLEAIRDRLEFEGYEVTPVSTLDEMMRYAETGFDVYLMDVNLGDPASNNILPAENFYRKVRVRVENGKSIFFATSNSSYLVGVAKEGGIPTIQKGQELLTKINELSSN